MGRTQRRAMRAMKSLKGRQDAHAAVVLHQGRFEGLAVGVGEFVHQVGGRGHALHAGQRGKRLDALHRHGREQPGVTHLADHQKHGGGLLQFARGLACARAVGKLDHAFDLVVRVHTGDVEHGGVDVHQVAVGVGDDDGARAAGAVQVLDRHALAAKVNRIEAPGNQRLGGTVAVRAHLRVNGGEPVDHRFHRAQAAPDLALRVAPVKPAQVVHVPHAAFLEVAVAFYQAGHEHLVGKARVQRVRPPLRQRGQVAHAQNAPVTHRHVRGLRLHRVHGDDVAGGVDGDGHGGTHKRWERGRQPGWGTRAWPRRSLDGLRG